MYVYIYIYKTNNKINGLNPFVDIACYDLVYIEYILKVKSTGLVSLYYLFVVTSGYIFRQDKILVNYN